MPHTSFTSNQKKQLLKLAETAINSCFDPRNSPKPVPEDWQETTRATFVTLKKEGALRGCIGSIQPVRSLFEDIWLNAQAAAFQDPRFAPIEEDELDSISIELSVLTEVQPLNVQTELELLSALRPGIDGLVLEDGIRKATFLPSVWNQLTNPKDFLNHLRLKAGMPEGYWSHTIECSVYQVDKIIQG